MCTFWNVHTGIDNNSILISSFWFLLFPIRLLAFRFRLQIGIIFRFPTLQKRKGQRKRGSGGGGETSRGRKRRGKDRWEKERTEEERTKKWPRRTVTLSSSRWRVSEYLSFPGIICRDEERGCTHTKFCFLSFWLEIEQWFLFIKMQHSIIKWFFSWLFYDGANECPKIIYKEWFITNVSLCNTWITNDLMWKLTNC